MTLGLSDGERIYAVRYSTCGETATLFHSKSMEQLRKLNPGGTDLSDDALAVVSEPLSELQDWVDIGESTAIVVDHGRIMTFPFRPSLPD